MFIVPLFLATPMKINFIGNGNNGWNVINDGVMGGLSKGKTIETEEGIVFFGNVSLENNGGFSSYRGPWKEYDLSNYKTVTIRYRSEGIRLAFVLETSKRFWVPNYKISLSKSDEWTTDTFDLNTFKQYRLGNPTGEILSTESKNDIIRIGFITNEKRSGDFKFEVEYIEFN